MFIFEVTIKNYCQHDFEAIKTKEGTQQNLLEVKNR